MMPSNFSRASQNALRMSAIEPAANLPTVRFLFFLWMSLTNPLTPILQSLDGAMAFVASHPDEILYLVKV
jgi:hypothetical protein